MPKPRPSSTRRPSAISRHSSVSYKYSPDSCEVTPLIRLSSTSDAEARQAYRKGKIVGVLLALGFLVCVGLFLLSIDVWVWRKRREEGNGLREGGRGGGGAGGMSGLLGVGSVYFISFMEYGVCPINPSLYKRDKDRVMRSGYPATH
ncbi:hypothetical protein DL95DRAFT_480567 [Leptodontidium sp. 2 PMI_412]|nr:hypothetical protein DL95DRAFT_480567 [Leptodontidium sp. 2 PMI_412]